MLSPNKLGDSVEGKINAQGVLSTTCPAQKCLTLVGMATFQSASCGDRNFNHRIYWKGIGASMEGRIK